MRHVQPDMAQLGIVLVDHDDFPGRLNPEHRSVALVNVEIGDAAGPATLARGKWDFAREHFVIGLLHLLLRPGLQDRIAKVSDVESGLPGRALIGGVRMSRIVSDRTWTA